jgi:uncharacterized protein YjbI with pentapeptide repeats
MVDLGVASTRDGTMERDEALELLRRGLEGIAEWNRRREAGEEIPDLGGADLSGDNLHGANLGLAKLSGTKLGRADLSGAKLSGAYLGSADLSGAYLGSADLSGAYLQEAGLPDAILNGADLRNAILRRANLNSANLSGSSLGNADLRSADFRGADLSRADLRFANLGTANLNRANLGGAKLGNADLRGVSRRRADLSGANLGETTCSATVFADVDLSAVNGLDSVRHEGPSTVGIDTLFRSRGKIPEAFLRGCGVPETLITHLPSLIGSMDPIQFYSCFISYSSKNRDFAERLHADLQAKGVRCWFDQEDLKIGEKFRQHIDTAIRVHDKLMLVLSEQSIASDWVESEVEAALEREGKEKRVVLFPIRLDDAVLESPVAWASHVKRTRHIGDFCGWKDHDTYQKSFDRLLRDLRASEGAK